MLISLSIFAQEKVIKGKITSKGDGQPIPGASITVKGTNIGTNSTVDGEYSIKVFDATSVLLFQSVGFKTLEIPVNDRSVINVELESETLNLSEVVVTGLASSIKRSNTANSIASISGDALAGKTNAVSLDAALAGKFAGAVINQTSGAPGGGVSVQLRGISTIAGASQPLYIIDGVIIDNSTNGNGSGSAYFTGGSSSTGRSTQDNTVNRVADLNPNDIANIEILKGPSAAAIYGTRANAGVILITTKRGNSGQTKINVSQDFGSAKAIKLLGKSDWTVERIKDLYGNVTSEINLLLAAQASGKIYDYEKEIYGNTGGLYKTRLSVSGGDEKTKFYLAGSTGKEEGIAKNTGAKSSSIRLNLDHKLNKKISVTSGSNYLNSQNDRSFFGNDNNGISIPYSLAYIPSYHELHQRPDGTFPDETIKSENPLALIDKSVNNEKTNRFIQSFSTAFQFLQNNQHNLKFVANGGLDYYLTEAITALPADLQSQLSLAPSVRGISRFSTSRSLNTNLQGIIVYNYNSPSLNSRYTSQAGFVRLTTNRQLSFNQGRGMIVGELNPLNSAVRDLNVRIIRSQDVGMFFQQEANFHDIFIATAGVRFDKSSLISNNEKFYAFPKASVAFNIANLGFWKFEKVNQLKLRAAYGESGGVPNFGDNYYEYDANGIDGSLGVTPSYFLGLDNLEPERAQELELGIDVGLFENKVSLEATFYNKEVKNLLNIYTLARSTGYSSVLAYPIGDLRNRGVELTLNYNPVVTKNFKWSGTTSYFFNRSKVIKGNVPLQVIGSGFGDSFGVNIWQVGESPSRWFGRPNNVAGNPGGYTRYGDAQPDFQMTFSNNFNLFKQFDLSFLLHWKQGGYNSNLVGILKDEGGTSKDWDAHGLERLNEFGTNLNNYIESSTYLRLREVSLYYNLPASALGNIKFVKNLRLGVSGNNIFTITKYSGYDPEVSNFGNVANGAPVDVSSFPNTRRLFLHLSADF